MRVKEPLGNLIATADQLISLSPIELTAYTIRDRLRAEFDLEFAQGANSSASLQRRGKVQLAEGKIAEALDSIEGAYRLNKNDPEVRFLLGEVAMMAIRSDFAKFASRIAEYEELIHFGPEKSTYLILLIDGLTKQKKYLQAARKLLELTDSQTDDRFAGAMSQELIEPETGLQVRLDVWVAARLGQLYESASPEQRKALEALIRPRIESLAKFRRTTDYYRLLDNFRWLPLVSEMRLSDAETNVREGKWLQAELAVEEAMSVLEAFPWSDKNSAEPNGAESSLANREAFEARANAIRFQIYNAIGRWSASVPLAQKLSEPLAKLNTKSTVKETFRGPQDVARDSIALADLERYAQGVDKWPNQPPTVTVAPAEYSQLLLNGGAYCAVKQRVGNALRDWSVYPSQVAISLQSPTGQQRIVTKVETMRLDQNVPPVAHFIDSIAIVETQSELVAMDTLRAAEVTDLLLDSPMEYTLWREWLGRAPTEETNVQIGGMPRRGSFSQAPRDELQWGERRLKNRKGFVVGPVARTGVLVLANGAITAYDPRTGTARWIRNRLDKLEIGGSTTLAQDGFEIVVLDPTSKTRAILDARDGRLISMEAWNDDFDVWTTVGHHVLSTYVNKREGNRVTFRVWNARTMETLVEREFTSDVRAELCEQERLVTWKASGELALFDLRSGKIFEHQVELPPKAAFRRLAAERFGDAILVMTDGPMYQLQDDLVRSDESEGGFRCRGPMIAIDAHDGHPLWEKPIIAYDYRFPVHQLRTTPAVALVRLLRYKLNTIPEGRSVEPGSVALLDVRTGKLLYSNHYLESARGGIEFRASTSLAVPKVNLTYRGTEIKLDWSTPASGEPAEFQSEIGKLDRQELEAGTPKAWLDALQSRDTDNPFSDGPLNDLFRAPVPVPAPETDSEEFSWMSHPDNNHHDLDRIQVARQHILEQISRTIVGQQEVIEQLLISIFSRGHCLLEGVPGLAKTLMISSLARTMNLSFSRIQFTPDLMPADITGTEIIEENRSTGARERRFLEGPLSPTWCWLTKSIERPPRHKPRCSRRCRNDR